MHPTFLLIRPLIVQFISLRLIINDFYSIPVLTATITIHIYHWPLNSLTANVNLNNKFIGTWELSTRESDLYGTSCRVIYLTGGKHSDSKGNNIEGRLEIFKKPISILFILIPYIFNKVWRLKGWGKLWENTTDIFPKVGGWGMSCFELDYLFLYLAP